MDLVRPLQPEDEGQISALVRQLTGTDCGTNVSAALATPNVHTRVAERDGKIVGTVTLVIFTTVANGLQGRLEDFVVDARVRNAGIGTRLIKDAVDLAKRQGLTRLSLTSNPARKAARRIFERQGFVKIETDVLSLRLAQRRRGEPGDGQAVAAQ